MSKDKLFTEFVILFTKGVNLKATITIKLTSGSNSSELLISRVSYCNNNHS